VIRANAASASHPHLLDGLNGQIQAFRQFWNQAASAVRRGSEEALGY
jgi:hypothetical protein